MQSGQLIAGRPNSMPWLTHYGIILKEGNEYSVLHNTIFKGVGHSSLEQWLSSRKALYVKPTGLENYPNSFIVNRFNTTCNKPYHVLFHNCEHFADCMLGKPAFSEQVRKFLMIGIGLILLAVAVSACLLKLK